MHYIKCINNLCQLCIYLHNSRKKTTKNVTLCTQKYYTNNYKNNYTKIAAEN